MISFHQSPDGEATQTDFTLKIQNFDGANWAHYFGHFLRLISKAASPGACVSEVGESVGAVAYFLCEMLPDAELAAKMSDDAPAEKGSEIDLEQLNFYSRIMDDKLKDYMKLPDLSKITPEQVKKLFPILKPTDEKPAEKEGKMEDREDEKMNFKQFLDSWPAATISPDELSELKAFSEKQKKEGGLPIHVIGGEAFAKKLVEKVNAREKAEKPISEMTADERDTWVANSIKETNAAIRRRQKPRTGTPGEGLQNQS